VAWSLYNDLERGEETRALLPPAAIKARRGGADLLDSARL
jgi:hypothetical protein